MMRAKSNRRSSFPRILRTLPLAAILAFDGSASSSVAFAQTSSTFRSEENPNGGTIVTGTLGHASLTSATALMLREVHARLHSRPVVVQVAQNARAHSLALLFTVDHDGTPCTGIAMITAASPGAQAGGAVLYDTTARFKTTVGSLMHRLNSMTGSHAAPSSSAGTRGPGAPAEPLLTHQFADNSGSIGLPPDWVLLNAGGGSVRAHSADFRSQVQFNFVSSAIDDSDPATHAMGQLPQFGLPPVPLRYTSDPAKAWVDITTAQGKANGFPVAIHVIRTSPPGPTRMITGTMTMLTGSHHVLNFTAYAYVTPPLRGRWSVGDTHLFIAQDAVASQGATAFAVFGSVRINEQVVAQQNDAMRAAAAKQFQGMIASQRAQNDARSERVDRALANDAAAQESMHRQAVSMENYSLDRAVVVDTRTGEHSRVDSSFADDFVRDDSNYQKVPAQNLLRGVDY